MDQKTPSRGRTLMTANIAYAHLVGKIPFVAHEGCKEKSQTDACDFRRPKSQAAQDVKAPRFWKLVFGVVLTFFSR